MAFHDRDADMISVLDTHSGKTQKLALGTGCNMAEFTFEPARFLVRCEGTWDSFLWAPDEVLRVPRSIVLGSERWNRRRWIRSTVRHSFPEDVPEATTWLDVIDRTAITYGPTQSIAHYELDRHVLFARAGTPDAVYVLTPHRGQAYRLPVPIKGCSSYRSETAASTLTALSCLQRSGATRWMEVIDLDHHVRWKAPHLRAPNIWLLPETNTIVSPTPTGTATTILKRTLR